MCVCVFEGKKNHTTETLTPIGMGTLFMRRREKINSYLHVKKERKKNNASKQKNDELTALCNLITSYYGQLDRCLFYGFSISFFDRFRRFCDDVQFNAQAVCATSFVFYTHTHTHIFRHLFMWLSPFVSC